MTRVLSTAEAEGAIARIASIANDQLLSQLAALQREGSLLSDPSIWDGLEATRFRGDTWPATSGALARAVEALEMLRQHIERVNRNIMVAGGNG
ncbi:MAG: hypothetical protein R2770_21955 [Acidimicrobiales bacterium]|nr:hypothetical protein [Acidimicrobiales bacterium]